MANQKHKNTQAEKDAQRRRTHANKRAKYERLLKEDPKNKDAEKWREKMAKIGA